MGAGDKSGSGHYPGRSIYGGDYLPGAFGSGGVSGQWLLVTRPGEEITKKISDWEPVAHPVPDTTLDSRLMEGTTYLGHSTLGVSLDSGLMEGMSSLEPLEQSVLKYVFDVDSRTVPNFPRLSATPGEMCTMDVGFRSDVNVPRTSSNPGEKCAGELGCRSVLGFSQVDSAQSKCGAVELDFHRANCPPGEIGAECDYIMPARWLDHQTWNAYHIKEGTVSGTLMLAGRYLRPYPTCLARGARMLLMARWSSWDAVLVDLHAGDTGAPWRDVAAIRPRRDAAPGYACGPVGRWGMWPLSVSGPGGQSVTGGPVGHLGTLPSSTFEPVILLDPGGTSPSSDLPRVAAPGYPC